jgi:ATP-binding cassette subfamily G (WHITE) protein 2 (PDR)
MPAKIAASLGFNITLYFMTNLRRTRDAFFTFWLLSFACLMAMSMFFRYIGSVGRTHDQIMVPIGIVIMLCIIYAGFIIPIPYMKPWLSWFRWIDPVAYAFESLIINEVGVTTITEKLYDLMSK